MPLHPIAKKFIELAHANGSRPMCGLPVDEARRISKEMFAFAPPGEPVAKVEGISIPGPAGDIPARVYTPAGDGPMGILVWLHGGGWVLGDLDGSDFECRAITNAAGCIVVSVDYRLAPEHKFPAPAEDAYQATRWVAENAASLGGVPGAVAVGGASAGGNLAAAVALMARDRGGPALASQVLIVPVTDCGCDTRTHLEFGDDYLLSRDEMLYFWGHYLATPDAGDHPYASPLRAPDLTGLAPACVHTAEFDPLCDEGDAYAARLQAAGVPVVHRCYEGMIHMVQGPAATVDLGTYLKEAFSPFLNGGSC